MGRTIPRGFALLALLTAAAVVAAACARAQAPASAAGKKKFEGRTMTFVSWGGAYQEAETKAYIEPWAELTGATVLQQSPTDYAKIRSQVEARHVTWDVVDTEPNFAVEGCEKGWLEPIAYDQWATFGYGATQADLLPQLVHECGMPNMQFAYAIGYNKDAFPTDHPHTWAEVWDLKKYPGKRCFWKYVSGGQLEAALLADGVPPDQLYPLDLDRALRKLDEIKDQIIWYETGEQQAQLLASGECVVGQVWNGRIYDIKQEGANVDVDFNQYLATYDTLVIPKGSKNVDMAQDFIAYVASVKAQAALTKYITYAPTNVKAFSDVNPENAAYLPTYPDNLRMRGAIMNYDWWAENFDQATEKFNDWLAA